MGNFTRSPCHDWMRQDLPPDFELTPWQQWMRNLDWSQSSIGTMSAWPLQLRQMVLLITQDPQPAAVYWGDRHIHVYNEAYTHLLGGKHPSLQGHDPHVILDKVWGEFDAILYESKITGQAHVGDGHMLLYTRNGFLEETYYSWKFVPILGEDGTVVAFHGSVNEVTRDVLGGQTYILNQRPATDFGKGGEPQILLVTLTRRSPKQSQGSPNGHGVLC